MFIFLIDYNSSCFIIAESNNKPRRPPLEVAVTHAQDLVRLMANNGLGACAFTSLSDVLEQWPQCSHSTPHILMSPIASCRCCWLPNIDGLWGERTLTASYSSLETVVWDDQCGIFDKGMETICLTDRHYAFILFLIWLGLLIIMNIFYLKFGFLSALYKNELQLLIIVHILKLFW